MEEPFKRYRKGHLKGRIIWADEDNAKAAAEYFLLRKIGYDTHADLSERISCIEDKVMVEGGTQRRLYDAGLESLIANKRPFFEHNEVNRRGSPLYFFLWFDEEVFDPKQPRHLHEWDFSPNYYWNDEELSRKAVDHVLFETVGYQKNISTAKKVEKIRQVLAFADQSKGTLAFMKAHRLNSLVSNRREFLEKVNSPLAFFKWYAPELLQQNLKSHIHDWELSPDWKDEAYARNAVKHVLTTHIDRTKSLAENFISYKGEPKRYLRYLGLAGLVSHERAFLAAKNSPMALVRWYLKDNPAELSEFEQRYKIYLNQSRFHAKVSA